MISGHGAGRTYPTPAGGVVRNQEISLGGQQFNLNRLFYLQDTEVDDGAVVVVPGSHRMGRISPGAPQAPIPGEVMLTPRAGTLVLLHGHIYHRVTPNVSLRPRVSVNLRAYPADVPREITRIGLYRNAAYDFLAGKRIDR